MLFALLFFFLGGAGHPCASGPQDPVLRIEFKLSAMGVESEHFPSIEGKIDFAADSGIFTKSYYNPAYKDSTYYLSHAEIKQVAELLQTADLSRLQPDYRITWTDQPTSTVIFHTAHALYKVVDYGLKGDYPLQALYDIVYKIY